MIVLAIASDSSGYSWSDCWVEVSDGSPPPTERWTASSGVQTAREAIEDFAAWLGDAARSWAPVTVEVTYADGGAQGAATLTTTPWLTVEDASGEASALLGVTGGDTPISLTLAASVGADADITAAHGGAVEAADGRGAGWNISQAWRTRTGWPSGTILASRLRTILDAAQEVALAEALTLGATAEGRRADVLTPDGTWLPVAVADVSIEEAPPLAVATLTVAPWEG